MRIPQRAESWTHGPLSLATAQAARWPAVQPGQVPALICPLQRGTQHGKPAGPGAGTVAHPWSEILGTQQGTRSKVAKNSPPPFLGVPVGAPVECRQKGTVQPGTLIDEAVWHPCQGVGSRESLTGLRCHLCHSLICLLFKSCTCSPSCAHCLGFLIRKVGILRMPLSLNLGRIRYVNTCSALTTSPGRNMTLYKRQLFLLLWCVRTNKAVAVFEYR